MTKFYKMIFFSSMITGTLITINSYTWFGMWLGMEINMLSIIPLFSSIKNMYSSEAAMKYFITQALASLIFIASIVSEYIMNEIMINSHVPSMAQTAALLLKLGVAPLHFWFPEVIEGLTWMNALTLLTWQKIAPMIIIMNTPINKNLILISIIACLSVSGIMALNQISLRKIMAFSSINHMAWMLAAMMSSTNIWLIYLLIYFMVSFNIVIIFNLTSTFYLNQIIMKMNQNKPVKIAFMINFMSMGGLPPFIGFLPKWFLINELLSNHNPLMAWMLIMMTLIMLFIYMQLIFTSLIISHTEPKLIITTKLTWLINLMNLISINSLIFYTLITNIA